MLATLRARGLAVALSSLALSVAPGLQAAGAGTGKAPEAAGPSFAHSYEIRIASAIAAGTVRRVLDGARERLEGPRCQQVFEAFRGIDGRPLRDHLAEAEATPADYLERVLFYDGRTFPQCRQKGVLAFTSVGSRIVWICPADLAAQVALNPGFAEAAFIHEALHTLGLGENPPSSREITSRVLKSCPR